MSVVLACATEIFRRVCRGAPEREGRSIRYFKTEGRYRSWKAAKTNDGDIDLKNLALNVGAVDSRLAGPTHWPCRYPSTSLDA